MIKYEVTPTMEEASSEILFVAPTIVKNIYDDANNLIYSTSLDYQDYEDIKSQDLASTLADELEAVAKIVYSKQINTYFSRINPETTYEKPHAVRAHVMLIVETSQVLYNLFNQ